MHEYRFFLCWMAAILVLTGGILGAEPRRKAAIVYFSVPESSGVDAVAGASRIVENGKISGNTEWVASVIAGRLGIPTYRITPLRAYPGVHEALVDQASDELKAKARPKLAGLPDLRPYDVIFVGYPIWWADLPTPVYSFLEATSLAGKTLIPFSTHGGSGWAGTTTTLASLEPRATVVSGGLSLARGSVAQSRGVIQNWLKGLGYAGSAP